MAICWLCSAEVTEKTAAGKRGTSLAGTCRACNSVYAMIRILQRMTSEDLAIKIKQLERRMAIHKMVQDNRDMKIGELSKKAINEIP